MKARKMFFSRKTNAYATFCILAMAVYIADGVENGVNTMETQIDSSKVDETHLPISPGPVVGNTRLTVTEYYETLCHGSRLFFKDLFQPNYLQFKDYIYFELVPWGFAEVTSDGKLKCQHGEDECAGNTYQACALRLAKSEDDQLKYCACVMTTDGVQAYTSCGQGIQDFAAIETCAKGEDGITYSKELGDITKRAQPPLQSVPAMYIDGKPVTDQELNMMSSDFVSFMCMKLPSVKPQCCEGRPTPPMPSGSPSPSCSPSPTSPAPMPISPCCSSPSMAPSSSCSPLPVSPSPMSPPPFHPPSPIYSPPPTSFSPTCSPSPMSPPPFYPIPSTSPSTHLPISPGPVVGNTRITVTEYYETLCHGSRLFFKDLFQSNYLQFKDYIYFELVPWGFAEVTSDGKLKCQHGEDECAGNTYQACALRLAKSEDDQLKYCACVMTTDGVQAYTSCGQGIQDFAAIETCAKGEDGITYSKELGDITKRAQPPLQSIPAMYINGKPLTDQELNMMSSDFISFMCMKLPSVKPQCCEGRPTPPMPSGSPSPSCSSPSMAPSSCSPLPVSPSPMSPPPFSPIPSTSPSPIYSPPPTSFSPTCSPPPILSPMPMPPLPTCSPPSISPSSTCSPSPFSPSPMSPPPFPNPTIPTSSSPTCSSSIPPPAMSSSPTCSPSPK